MRWPALGLLVALAPAALAAQSSALSSAQTSPLDSLAVHAARLTARYADRREAVADGYRRIGTDFPGMGEHWLHPGALLVGGIDPARPTILNYAVIGGRPTLLGVAFVITTRGAAAADAPGWPSAWHEHSGLLSDESGAGAGHATTPAPDDQATHVWVLHAWMGLDNPGGRYAADNWALPFVRAGLAAPSHVDADAGRACALVVGGDAYLRAVLRDAGLLTDAHASAVDAAIDAARTQAAAIVAHARTTDAAGDADLLALGSVWRSLGAALTTTLGPGVAPFLAPPHAAAHAGMHTATR